MIYYTILYYTILYYTILYCTIVLHYAADPEAGRALVDVRHQAWPGGPGRDPD